jgi:hypothetical protein
LNRDALFEGDSPAQVAGQAARVRPEWNKQQAVCEVRNRFLSRMEHNCVVALGVVNIDEADDAAFSAGNARVSPFSNNR